MIDPRELLSLFVLQDIFCHRPRIGLDLMRAAGSASALLEGDRSPWRERFGTEEALWNRFSSFADWGGAERSFRSLASCGARIVGIDDEAYPELLREIYDPPLALFVRGEADGLFASPSVAIVGSRKASPHGKSVAAEIAEHLSSRGVAVASGMAWGIDAAAHRGALAGLTGTIAVWGAGIDIVYPAAHADLARRIEETGLIVSEFPPGTRPAAPFFPQRNRIISGLSLATVVVEAAQGSGSLITARFALEQGREVMACPGRARDLLSQGTHRLIRSGAALVESGEEVFALIAGHPLWSARLKKTGLLGGDGDKDTALLPRGC